MGNAKLYNKIHLFYIYYIKLYNQNHFVEKILFTIFPDFG